MTAKISNILIEVCVDSVDSALAAVRGGADRLELCGNLGIGGGTTPSIGLLKAVQKAVPNTPIMAMIRPRTGDFVYSASELQVMVEDIHSFKALGVTGVVFGVLTCGGRIHVDHTELLVQAALPLEVCFHRAFDMTVDYEEALVKLSNIQGITRILTSGLRKSIVESIADGILPRIFYQAKNVAAKAGRQSPVSLLIGSGINPVTVNRVLAHIHIDIGLCEIHLTGGRWVEGGMWHRPEGMDMGPPGNEWSVWRTSEEAIREVRLQADESILKCHNKGNVTRSN